MEIKKILFIFLFSLAVFIACSDRSLNSQSFQQIAADNSNFQYIGRVDRQNPQAPIFSFPATACLFNFEGTSLKLKLADDNWGESNYIGVYLDNNPKPIIIHLNSGNEPQVYEVAKKLEDKNHQALIVKRNDYITGEFSFHGILIDNNKNLLSPPQLTNRKIEVYGDSISAGSTVEYEQTGTQDPSGDTNHLSNSYLSFGAMLARDYQAQLSLVAQAGIALVDGYGFWHDGIGMEAVYDQIKPLKDAPSWDFNQYIPNLVIVALGQNDASSIDLNSDLTSTEWKQHYKNFVANLRSKYPNAYFICMFPNMYHDRAWDNYLNEAVTEYKNEQQDNKIHSLITEQVTPGHPRVSEQQLMADALKNLIDTTLVQDGFSW
ncbi:electron transport complex, RnfABCDGE type, D subunit [Stanieria cyanosphaera PCC 7437]|uniref:Electron transport complex, RnfABCDGE type, D subunit n=1 Tax=Stanieria cyanosphaera (strain ATCC 29371 / PCC 7437) TaxID=111780 RepID=K9XRX2_STAC7|nr:GDSL-type esterase/lipase family protein [Stanieria cyanosphaera]AFZ35273.1 electron transport complex, RnfABCDGE type, D subunit [Stanieria cyanosphaera PCC 7437]